MLLVSEHVRNRPMPRNGVACYVRNDAYISLFLNELEVGFSTLKIIMPARVERVQMVTQYNLDIAN